MAMAYPTPFKVKASQRNGLAMLAVIGELDCDTAARLNEALTSLAGPGRVILVDLRDTEFMDCAGMFPLVEACMRQRRSGGDVVLDAPNGIVSRVIEWSQLDKVLTVVRDTTGPASSSAEASQDG
jgi:anti-anti-sigma factor